MFRVMNVCACRVAAIVFGLIALGPFSAAAQTVMDATTVEFNASADHNGVATDGTPLLSQTFTVNQAAAACTYAINPGSKTAAAGGETTTVNVTAGSSCAWTATNSASWVTIANGSSGSGNGSVTLTVAANTGGTVRTTALTIAGQAFTITQPASGSCSNTIAPEIRTAAATGEPISVAVTAGGSCIWSAASTVTWLLVTSGNSGMGNGTVAVLVSGNSTSSTRTGVVNIAGRTLTVTQPAQTGCSYAVSPLSYSAPAAGATTSAAVTAGTGCAWTASSSAAWIMVTGGGIGSGAGTVSMSVAANTAATQRSGLVTIAGQVFSVTQAGASTCGYSINPASTNTAAAGGTASISVTAGTGCVWNAASTAAWIMVSSGANGNGNGTVTLTIAANTALTSRTGTVNLGGQVFTVTQAAATCTYTVTPTTLSVPAFGLTSALTVGTGASCSWAPSGVPSWITMSTATRTGSGQLAYTISANPGIEARTATVMINGVSVTVTQSTGAPPAPSGFRVVGGLEPQQQ
jgi:Putative binding domain, N-terminal/Viral BACON domain